jgi:hypothetical protein
MRILDQIAYVCGRGGTWWDGAPSLAAAHMRVSRIARSHGSICIQFSIACVGMVEAVALMGES